MEGPRVTQNDENVVLEPVHILHVGIKDDGVLIFTFIGMILS